jgi:hypothetical protein
VSDNSTQGAGREDGRAVLKKRVPAVIHIGHSSYLANELIAILLDPLVLESLALTNLC